MTGIRLSLLGGFRAQAGDTLLRLPTRKAEALLAYLALHAGQAHPRDKLASLLWGETPDAVARANLRQTLSLLGKGLARAGVRGLVVEGRTAVLEPDGLDVDVLRFEREAADGTPEALERAIALYGGDLLQGLTITEAAFEEWLVAERERLLEVAAEAHARLLTHQRARGDIDRAIQTAQRLVSLDPLQEAVHRTLMRLYAQQGRRGAALRQYQVCAGVLERELSAEPEAETSQLYQELLRRPDDPLPTGLLATLDDVGSPLELAPPLIGRSLELGRLRDALERAWRSDGKVVAITGEAGVGKSRLVAELAVEAPVHGGLVLVGRAYESEHVLPFGPWINALRSSPMLRGEATAALDEPRRAELARVFPELGAPARRAVPAAENRMRLFEALLHLLGVLASRQPLLVVLEDLHWADEMSVRLLAFVGRRVPAHTLVVSTVRAEELGDVPRLRRVLRELDGEGALVTLPLSALSRGDTRVLVRALARSGTDAATVARLAEQVWNVSEGNPFVVVEAMRALGEASDASAPMPDTLPGPVRDLVATQLERLSDRGRGLAAVAGVIGRKFDFALLRAAAGLTDAAAAEGVEELVRRRILYGIGERFDFTHDRIRSGVYTTLLPPRRRVLHGAVGVAIEALYSADLEPHHAALSRHFREAEVWSKAIEYRVHLARTATRVHAHAEAAAALGEACDLIVHLPAADQDRRRGELVLALARSLTVLGRLPDALATLAKEADTVARLDDPALTGHYHFLAGNAQSLLGDGDAAVASASRSLVAATRAGDILTQGRAHYVLALEGFWSGRLLEGVAHGRQAVSLCSASGEPGWVALAHWALAFNFILMGEFGSALDAARRVREIGDEVHDDRLRQEAAWLAGGTLAFMGECDTAIVECERGLEGSAHPLHRAVRLAWLGHAHLESGDTARAITLIEDALEHIRRFRFRSEGWFTAWLAEAHLLEGRVEAAQRAATHALDAARAAKQGHGTGTALRALGRIALARGAHAETQAYLDEALAAFTSMHARFEVGRTCLALADAARVSGDDEGEGSYLRKALDAFRALEVPRYVARAERAVSERAARIRLSDGGAGPESS